MGVHNPGAPWAPILIRSAVAAAYGALTVFWQEPDDAVLTVAGGLFLLLTGAAMAVTAVSAGQRRPLKPLLLVEAAVYAAAALTVLLVGTTGAFCLAAAAALIIAGALELALWRRFRTDFLPARDWLITGGVSVGSGILLPVFLELGAHAQLGVSGGGAIIVAVILAISGFGARHDARSSGHVDGTKAVN